MPTDVRGPNWIVPVVGREGAVERVEEVGLAGPVRADQADPLAVVDLVAERQEQVADRDVGELDHPPGGVGAAEADDDLLLGDRRRRRPDLHELLPAGLGRVGLGGVLEVLRGALLHDLHVVEQAALLLVPPLRDRRRAWPGVGPGPRGTWRTSRRASSSRSPRCR
jgi:hypothetical protein